MPRRLLKILPTRPQQFVDRNLHTIGYVLLVAYVTVIGGLALDGVSDEGRKRDERLNQNRVEVALDNCRGQNARHDNTIRRLDEQIAEIPPGARRDRADRSRDFTVSLIDALAPKRDCRALVDQIRSAAD